MTNLELNEFGTSTTATITINLVTLGLAAAAAKQLAKEKQAILSRVTSLSLSLFLYCGHPLLIKKTDKKTHKYWQIKLLIIVLALGVEKEVKLL